MTPQTHTHNRRILVIDNNQPIHHDFRKIFNTEPADSHGLAQAEEALFGEAAAPAGPAGFHIDSAFQGQEGLAHVRAALENQQPYAMAFVDVRMPPGWDGIETGARIWEAQPLPQIVHRTAYSHYSRDPTLPQPRHTY